MSSDAPRENAKIDHPELGAEAKGAADRCRFEAFTPDRGEAQAGKRGAAPEAPHCLPKVTFITSDIKTINYIGSLLAPRAQQKNPSGIGHPLYL